VDRRRTTSSIRIALLAAAVGFALVQAGCTSAPVRAFHGAHHYAAGTEALERQENGRAIRELELAAEWVPHASEVQNHLGLAYWAEGRVEQARDAFERSVALDCQNEAARSNLERLVRSSAEPIEIAPEASAVAPVGADAYATRDAGMDAGMDEHGQ
jgi:tetratricopeptide (TPR) repeat protein